LPLSWGSELLILNSTLAIFLPNPEEWKEVSRANVFRGEEINERSGLGAPCVAIVHLIHVCHKISQNFSPAGVTSPFVTRAMPTGKTEGVSL
jgi:hypothetical protein